MVLAEALTTNQGFRPELFRVEKKDNEDFITVKSVEERIESVMKLISRHGTIPAASKHEAMRLVQTVGYEQLSDDHKHWYNTIASAPNK